MSKSDKRQSYHKEVQIKLIKPQQPRIAMSHPRRSGLFIRIIILQARKRRIKMLKRHGLTHRLTKNSPPKMMNLWPSWSTRKLPLLYKKILKGKVRVRIILRSRSFIRLKRTALLVRRKGVKLSKKTFKKTLIRCWRTILNRVHMFLSRMVASTMTPLCREDKQPLCTKLRKIMARSYLNPQVES